ncbi:MAG: Slp family lipoprotein [Deltaproteobacteria bacterium]|nr:Slp family lipoprotein [Deltaproteobacteria bacterium]
MKTISSCLKGLSLLVCLVVLGCGPVISPALTRQASLEAGSPANFAQLRENPEQYRGKLVILGGEIISVSLQEGMCLLAVHQRDLDHHLQPYGPGYGGTFYVESEEFLPPSRYVKGRKVTVAGVVKGSLKGSPLLQARQIHLGDYPPWEEWYYPIPREWYNGDPNLEYWFTPPYFDPWRGSM